MSAIAPELRGVLVCPTCRGALTDGSDGAGIACTSCGAHFPTRAGIPILLAPDLQELDQNGAHFSSHKARQIAFFDEAPADDFGVTRPHGAPRLYERLLRDKFRRSILGLEHLIPGSTALVVCGGSGLDANFLVEGGAHVILSDLALGAVLQAEERSRRFELALDLIVADAEALPFADRSIDVVYVHDGLHHLERPDVGLAELARVARLAVSVTEPARSGASELAVRIGWAESREDAGNPVVRFTLDEIVDGLRKHGFQPLRPHRYAMFYRHWPGRPMRMLSRPLLLPMATAGLRLANRLAGRFGNKLTVQAIRADR